jgi:16S rRNA (guanine(966)-N(2))-methyltransferase RsmD
MRIEGGAVKRRRLRAVPGLQVRPTSGRVRQALFNVLRGLLEDAIFVDLFAGTGSVGLEALSHGVRQVYFVENAPRALQVLHTNIVACAMTEQAIVINGTLPHALRQFRVPVQADVLFLDPPYASDLGETTLKAIDECRLLGPRGVVVWQHATRRPVPVRVAGFSLWQSRCYGNTQLSFYTLDTRL